MTLKISFESDIKGFERVQKALEAQNKALNDNADAAERFAKAQGGATGAAGSGGDMGKGIYNVKAFNEEIKGLTSSLDLLSSKRSGFSGFLSMFGEFGKEVKALNTDASINIFKTMGTQIDTLKNNMRGTSTIIRTIRQEIDEATAAGKGDVASKKTRELNELTTRQQLDQDMLTKLERSRMYRQPFGGFGGKEDGPGGTGGFLGGTSMERLVGLGRSIAVAAAAISKATDVTLKWRESSIRGEEMLFARQTQIAQGAIGGNVGRQLMTDMGIGEEGKYMQGGFFTDAKGDFDLNQSLRMTKNVFSKIWSPTKSFEQIRAEEANRLSEFDKSKQFGIDMAATTYKGWVMDPRFSELERQHGKSSQKVQAYISGMASRGIGDQDSIAGMQSLSELGLADDVLKFMEPDLAIEKSQRRIKALQEKYAATPKHTNEEMVARSRAIRNARNKGLEIPAFEEGAARRSISEEIEKEREAIKNYGAQAGRSEFADISLLNRDPADLGMSIKGQAEYRKQVAYNVNSGQTIQQANDAYLRDLSNFRVSAGIVRGETPEAVTKMAQEFVQMMQSQAGPGISLGAGAASGGMRSALEGMDGQPTRMTDVQKMSAAIQSQQKLQEDIGTPGSMMEMGSSHIMQRAGITNFAKQNYLQELMKTDPEKAYRIIAKSGGKMSADEVKAEMDSLTASSRKLQKDVLGYDDEFRDLLESENAPDMLLYARGMKGDVTAGKGYEAARFTKEMTGKGDSPFIGAEETTAQDIKATQAMSITKEVADLNKTLTEALGRDISDVLKDQIGGGLVRMGQQISDSVGKLKDQMSDRVNSSNNVPMPKAQSVRGGNEEQDKRLADPTAGKGATEKAEEVMENVGFSPRGMQ